MRDLGATEEERARVHEVLDEWLLNKLAIFQEQLSKRKKKNTNVLESYEKKRFEEHKSGLERDERELLNILWALKEQEVGNNSAA